MRVRQLVALVCVICVPISLLLTERSSVSDAVLGESNVRLYVKMDVERDELLRGFNAPYHEWRKRIRAKPPAKSVHTFYTIDCTYHSLWQVLALEMTWERVEQGGVISRVVSGCDAFRHKQPDLSRSVITIDAFGAYFAPTFSKLPNGDYYAPYNRPNAIWYWLNHTDLTEEVFVLLDPDMVYMKPLPFDNVKKGHPVAQHYFYMEAYPLNKFECPLCPPKGYDSMPYSVGPPWMLHLDDFRTIMATWVALVPMLRAIDKHWIIEMVAYSVAMAYHNLPHELIWFGMGDNQLQKKIWTEEIKNFTVVPSLLHYCFTWEIGARKGRDGQHPPIAFYQNQVKYEQVNKTPLVDYYMFHKSRVPTDWPGGNAKHGVNFMSCECPLMQEFHTRRAIANLDNELIWYRSTIFLDVLIPRVNDALTLWKRRYCAPESMNLTKRLRVAHNNYWISKYEITETHDELTVSFREVE